MSDKEIMMYLCFFQVNRCEITIEQAAKKSGVSEVEFVSYMEKTILNIR